MLLKTYYNGIEVHRQEKIMLVKFLAPHRVLSTCRAAGGMRDGLEYVYNHQACEPTGYTPGLPKCMLHHPQEYRHLISERHGILAEGAATLETAVNMNNAAIVSETFRELEVVSICTGGVETNAGRVGDPAAVYEGEHGFEKLEERQVNPEHGTINTMVFINKELSPGAMVQVVVTATEAKTAVLQELAIHSWYSDGLATGTGTDQILVASMCHTGRALTSAGKHSKLGELIGKSVCHALKRTLALQNRLIPERQCSVCIHLERFGATPENMLEGIGQWLTTATHRLLRDNFLCIDRDPVTVAAVVALVHLKDTITWGILPEGCWPDIIGSYVAQIAATVSGKYSHLPTYREQLAPLQDMSTNEAFLNLVYRAIALGFREKWAIF